MQRYFAKDMVDNHIILHDSDMHHIKNVMRMSSEDDIECILDSKLYLCKVGDVNSNRFSIIGEIDENNELDVDITIAIGLVKEQKMDLILQKLTELGVKRIIPVSMERSIVKLDDNKFKKKRVRWEAICKEASEQSHRNIVPEITDIMSIKELNNINADIKMVCSVKERENLVNKYLQDNIDCATMIFVIGPEGGISDKEESLLNSFGYESVSLGSRVMRVETAAIYVASVMNFCSMR